MDKKPISQNRARLIEWDTSSETKRKLIELGERCFLAFDLKSIIRLDIRADRSGEPHVLEANPKPDLKKPEKDIISLATVGLAEHGMDYDDLIFSLIADRLDFLMRCRRPWVSHLAELL